MKSIISFGITITLSMILTFGVVLFKACSRQSFISNARAAHASYLEAEPLFKQLGVPTERLTQAANIANDLITAFEQNQNETALLLVQALIRRTNEIIAEDVSIIKDESRRVQVMAILALGNIALHWIASNIINTVNDAVAAGRSGESAPGRSTAAKSGAALRDLSGALEEVKAFAAKEPWGKAYAH